MSQQPGPTPVYKRTFTRKSLPVKLQASQQARQNSVTMHEQTTGTNKNTSECLENTQNTNASTDEEFFKRILNLITINENMETGLRSPCHTLTVAGTTDRCTSVDDNLSGFEERQQIGNICKRETTSAIEDLLTRSCYDKNERKCFATVKINKSDHTDGSNHTPIMKRKLSIDSDLLLSDFELTRPPTKRVRFTDQTIHMIDHWRRMALDFITSSRNIFVLEVYTYEHFLLQVKISSIDTELFLNTEPWSITRGKSVSRREFNTTVGSVDSETEQILDFWSVEFSPSRLVRFVLDNCDGIPAIVSSDYKNIEKQKPKRGILDYLVYDKPIPGSQHCFFRGCKLLATALQTGIASSPRGIYCSRHVRELGIDDDVLLYNPLLVAFNVYEERILISALDADEVFRQRCRFWVSHATNTRSTSLKSKWIPIFEMVQPVRIVQNTGLAMLIETANNLLDCAQEHLWRIRHATGVHLRHSLTCCLFEHFLSHSGDNQLCSFIDESSQQNVQHYCSRNHLDTVGSTFVYS